MDEAMKKTLHALGICAKARALTVGTPMICEAMRGARKPRLVLLAEGNSENTVKRLADKCAYYGVEMIFLAVSGEALAEAIGRSSRVAAVAVGDENLCRLVKKTLEAENPI